MGWCGCRLAREALGIEILKNVATGTLNAAFYHSAVNYTSLGYGDLVMTPSWRLLGPLETANGMLLFGVSTAMIFAVMLWLIQGRFTDLKP
jgi:hypothetical protein